jgi:hypothetical protein
VALYITKAYCYSGYLILEGVPGVDMDPHGPEQYQLCIPLSALRDLAAFAKRRDPETGEWEPCAITALGADYDPPDAARILEVSSALLKGDAAEHRDTWEELQRGLREGGVID